MNGLDVMKRQDQEIDHRLSHENWGRRKKQTPAAAAEPRRDPDFKATLKRIVLRNPSISIELLQRRLAKRGIALSWFTTASIKRAFLEDVRFLRERGYLKRDA